MRSMTGYGSAQCSVEGLELSLEIFSVNRKSIEVNCSLPREWQGAERLLQEIIRKFVFRGKLNVFLRVKQSSDEEGLVVSEEAMQQTLNRMQSFAASSKIDFNPDADCILRLMISLRDVGGELPAFERYEDALVSLAENALGSLIAMRETEGAMLVQDLEVRIDLLLKFVESIAQYSVGTVSRYQSQLMDRLEQSGMELDLNDDRILKEIALFADRCDVSEEITRLNSHLRQMIECLSAQEPIGRKMDFLCQEAFREFNTIGSKANSLDITKCIIECKNELERVREQVQNLE
ncbi:MAG TPA: YicC family protein [Opitutae bacterium]|nr:YicC family protein [Opitutae bacterium]